MTKTVKLNFAGGGSQMVDCRFGRKIMVDCIFFWPKSCKFVDSFVGFWAKIVDFSQILLVYCRF